MLLYYYVCMCAVVVCVYALLYYCCVCVCCLSLCCVRERVFSLRVCVPTRAYRRACRTPTLSITLGSVCLISLLPT